MLAAYAFRASNRHGYGLFVWNFNVAMYGAVGLLVVASLWNAWPIRGVSSEADICDHPGTQWLQEAGTPWI